MGKWAAKNCRGEIIHWVRLTKQLLTIFPKCPKWFQSYGEKPLSSTTHIKGLLVSYCVDNERERTQPHAHCWAADGFSSQTETVKGDIWTHAVLQGWPSAYVWVIWVGDHNVGPECLFLGLWSWWSLMRCGNCASHASASTSQVQWSRWQGEPYAPSSLRRRLRWLNSSGLSDWDIPNILDEGSNTAWGHDCCLQAMAL